VARYEFQTVDVFTDRRFGGNPLAVFPEASGLGTDEMQRLAFELNLSETTFVLPPENPANSARVRIFNRTAEMAFAGHPSIGTAYVLARRRFPGAQVLRLEVPAGIVPVDLLRDGDEVTGGRITTPQPLRLGEEIPCEVIAECLGLSAADVRVDTHAPVVATAGNPYVIVEVAEQALARCVPDYRSFRAALDARPQLGQRFSLHVYAHSAGGLRARMFAPLSGTHEDPATGSANAPLAALLLLKSGGQQAAFTVSQGEEMGRPSRLEVTAYRTDAGIYATVAGHCVNVFSGIIDGIGAR
jgi:trans-2,3-dihydro-3-hydroxyanthranilate isomerase